MGQTIQIILRSFLKKRTFLKTAAITTMLLFCFGVGVQNVDAQTTLNAWDTDGLSGTTADGWQSTTTASNILVAELSRGPGIDAASLENAFSSNGFTENGTRANAFNNGDFLEFTIEADSDFEISLSALDINLRRSSTGPDTFQWQFSLDGFATDGTDIGDEFTYTGTQTNGQAQDQIDLSEIDSIQNTDGAVTFRLYGWSATSTTGTLAIGRLSGDDLVVTGEVPVLSANPSALSGFTYIENNGPSSSQSFILSGENLNPSDATITITAPENFEVSLDNEIFENEQEIDASEGEILERTIYVRLKEDLSANLYSGDITISGGDAGDVNVDVSGEVESMPSLTALDDPYEENFSDFVSAATIPSGWSVSDENYEGDWGSGTSSGLRGNASVLGYQHTATTGTFTVTLTLRNETGNTIENLNISYLGKVERTGAGRSPEWAVEVDGIEEKALSYSTKGAVDQWIQTTVTDLSIENDEIFDIEFSSIRDDGSGQETGSSKQIGITDVSVEALSGDPIYQKQLTGIEGFRMLSAPVEVTLQDFLEPIWTQGPKNSDNPNSKNDNVFAWNTESAESDAFEAVEDLDKTLSAGIGFLVYVFEDHKADGTEVGFPRTLSVSGTEHSSGFTRDANENNGGFTLLGNPFATSISFDEFESESNNLKDAVYVWDVNDGETTIEHNSEEETISGSWKTYTVGSNNGDLNGGIIAPFQGFFVETDVIDENEDVSINFTDGVKTTGGTFLGKQAEPDRDVVRLELRGEGMRNSTWMVFSEDGSMEKAYGDAHQLDPLSANYALLASQKTNGLFDISMLPRPDIDFELPLEVDATLPGTYTLRATDFNASFAYPLYLEDRKENVSVELNEQTEYEFTLDGHPQKAITHPAELLADGPKMAKSSADSPRFFITAQSGGIDDPGGDIPDQVALEQNYPNPFNPATVINYDIPEQSHVRLAVYDLLGRQVDMLVNETRAAGTYNITFDGSHLSSGVYLYRLETAGQTITRQMTLIK